MNFYAVMGASMVPDLRVISDTPQLQYFVFRRTSTEMLYDQNIFSSLPIPIYIYIHIKIISLCEQYNQYKTSFMDKL